MLSKSSSQLGIASRDGTIIYADAIGNPENTAVVFLHGMAGAGTAFDALFAVKELVESIYMVRYDARGYGRSGKPMTAQFYESERYAEDFEAVVSAFALNKPFFAGWSLGAGIATDICAKRIPISGIFCIGGFPAMPSPEFALKMTTPLLRSFNPRLMSPQTPAEALQVRIDFCKALVPPTRDVPFADLAQWIGVATCMPSECAVLSVGRTHAEVLDGVQVPLCIIHGEEDGMIIGEVVIREMKERLGDLCEVALLDGLGHFVVWEDPERVARVVLDFIVNVRGARRNG